MKKRGLLLLCAALTVCITLTTLVSADFVRSKTYTAGSFKDVPADSWYATAVKDAYEFGLMEGTSATSFDPDGNLTVAQGITIAARINETLTGKTIPDAQGEWYTKYVSYAVSCGFMKEGQFDDLTRKIKRSEIAELLANVCGELPDINKVEAIPDVANSASYADKVLKLYKAGILTGNDDYGTFAPDSNLKRSEISTMAVRIADTSKRVQKTFLTKKAIERSDAYCIIEAVGSSGRNGLANGWNYDNRFDLYNSTGADKPYLNDNSDEKYFSLIRDFNEEKSGLVTLELAFNAASGDNGVYLAFEDEATEEKLFWISPKDGKWVFTGKTSVTTPVEVSSSQTTRYALIMNIDLDANTADLVMNNVPCGTIQIPDKAISRLVLGTNKVGKGSTELIHARMWKDYHINEHFFVTENSVGQKPCGWDVTGDFALDKILSVLGADVYSVKAESKAGAVSTATKSFKPLTGNIVFETFVLFPEKVDGATVCVMDGTNAVFTFETRDGKLYFGDKVVNDYTANVWQCLHIEADTNTGKAIVKVNGKEKLTTDFTAKSVDSVKINFAPKTDSIMWFDDIQLFNLVDHADYPSYPKVAESKDYNIGLNSCYLWRDTQSGEGWDSTSPFPEFDTYLGFYDEGLRETADWEIKWMAEHGIDFIHACWYSPYGNLTAPIKRMRVSYSALHDGYMNAKYSDLVDFCIMWENNGQDVTSFEQFKEYIWNYWVEYYFKDPRYARLDNKAVLTVWNLEKMQKAFGGAEGTKKAVQFMNDELKKIGYDGIIVLKSTQSANPTSFYDNLKSSGFDASYGYHWGPNGKDGNYQISCNQADVKAASGISHHIPTVSIGFNDVGRNETRDPIVSVSDHLKVCEDIKSTLSNFHTGTWKDNTLMVSTWNEFSEGTYIFPTASTGFDYLDNIRKVFTDSKGDDNDVKPTAAQVARVSHLYPPHHSPIRWLQFEKSDRSKSFSSSDLTPTTTFDMTKSEDTAMWRAQFGITDFSTKGGVLKGTSQQSDYAICTVPSFQGIPAATSPYLHIRLKTSNTGSFEVFFITDADGIYDGKKYKSSTISKKDEFVDYYVNMSENGAWKSTITGIRIDPLTVAGDFEISLIELMDTPKTDENAIPKVIVNGTELGFTFDPKVLDNGDLEVVGEARKMGFYSSLRLYHEWDRFTGDGVLTLKTFDEKTLVFTVGSNKVKINGKEQDLGYTFTLRDGLPVFHIKQLCTLIGWEYTVQGKTVTIFAANEEEKELIKNRVPNQWDFDLEGELEGWRAQNSSITASGGYLCGVATNNDPAVHRTVSFASNKYNAVIVGVVYDSKNMKVCQLFFTTSNSPSYTADKCINATYNTEGKKDGDIVEAVFDLNSNIGFTGTITGLRFDPFGTTAPYKIDYIKCVNDPKVIVHNEEKLVEIDDENQWTFDKDDDKMGWYSQNISSMTVFGGIMNCTPTNSDPAIMHKVSFDSDTYKYMIVKVVYNSLMSKPQMFYTTEESPSWTGDKCINGNYVLTAGIKEGDIIEARFTLGGANFKGKITNIRFDPYGANVPFSVDSVRFYK